MMAKSWRGCFRSRRNEIIEVFIASLGVEFHLQVVPSDRRHNRLAWLLRRHGVHRVVERFPLSLQLRNAVHSTALVVRHKATTFSSSH